LERVQEVELAALRRQQSLFERKRQSEMDRLMELTERQKNILDENARLAEQELLNKENAHEANEMHSIALLTKSHLSTILNDSIDEAEKAENLRNYKSQIEEATQALADDITTKTSRFVNLELLSRSILDGEKLIHFKNLKSNRIHDARM
jgi:hypothetical protein